MPRRMATIFTTSMARIRAKEKERAREKEELESKRNSREAFVMIRKNIMAAFLCALLVLLKTPGITEAEWFTDLYAGIAQAPKTDVTADIFRYPAPSISVTRSVSFDNSLAIGARGGYWFDRFHWLGLAADLSYFKADGNGVETSVIPLSLLVMLRIPLLENKDFPHGKLQPYAALGGGLFFYDISVDFRPDASKELGDSGPIPGLDARAGLTWQFHKHVGLFGEYRYTYFEIDHAYSAEGIKTNLGTHHWLLGISYRY
jgi:hypothetical protein